MVVAGLPSSSDSAPALNVVVKPLQAIWPDAVPFSNVTDGATCSQPGTSMPDTSNHGPLGSDAVAAPPSSSPHAAMPRVAARRTAKVRISRVTRCADRTVR